MNKLSVMKIADGFTNVLAGLGLANPKNAANTYVMNCSQADLEAAYRSSTWFGKIVDIPADDATREWRAWQGENDQIEKLEATEKRLQVRQRVRQAIIWARLYGGAVIIPGGLPGAPDTPLPLNRIGLDSVKYLTVLNRWEISTEGKRNNPLDSNYGEPEFYVVNTNDAGQVRFHPSRVIRFNGRTVVNRFINGDIWGDSIWVHLRDAVTNSDLGAAVIGALLTEAKIDVVRMPELMANMVSAEMEQSLMKRFQIAATLKSVSNVLILDKEDEWNQKTMNWAGLPDVVGMLLSIMSGAADIPVTRLIGTSAKGLNATGEGDLRNYYDMVKAQQELKLQPELTPLDDMLIRSALGTVPDDLWYSWKSLFQLSDKEKSEIDKRDAETAQIYANAALVPTDALEKATQNRMIESGRWPGLEQAIDEANAELDEPEPLDPDDDPDPFEESEQTEQNAADAAPRSLYVRRNVLNAAQIIKWAKSQGFKSTLPADDLHVTITFSRAAVDWLEMGENWSGDGEGNLTIQAGGPRVMERFGKAVVLSFASTNLAWRHQNMIEHGATWDHPNYTPHVTISYEFDGDIDSIEPYRGAIELGPEIFEEVNEDWGSGVTEQ